jgi:hypothetical protein
MTTPSISRAPDRPFHLCELTRSPALARSSDLSRASATAPTTSTGSRMHHRQPWCTLGGERESRESYDDSPDEPDPTRCFHSGRDDPVDLREV